jgi:hypothetical protein
MVAALFNNPSLCGHCLTSLPENTWDFAMSEDLAFFVKSDANLQWNGNQPLQPKREWCIFESYHKNAGIGVTMGTNILPLKYLELFFRRVAGPVFAATFCVTAAPLGFAIKLIHVLGQKLEKGFVSCCHSCSG